MKPARFPRKTQFVWAHCNVQIRSVKPSTLEKDMAQFCLLHPWISTKKSSFKSCTQYCTICYICHEWNSSRTNKRFYVSTRGLILSLQPNSLMSGVTKNAKIRPSTCSRCCRHRKWEASSSAEPRITWCCPKSQLSTASSEPYRQEYHLCKKERKKERIPDFDKDWKEGVEIKEPWWCSG